MAEFTWSNMTLFVILLLQLTAVTGEKETSVMTRAGDEVTLPCENVIKDQNKCDQTSWLYFPYSGAATQELITHGQIGTSEFAKAKSDRLSVIESCSLVITNVKPVDVGQYNCRQFERSGQKQGPDAVVVLSVINMAEHQNNDTIILFCSLMTYVKCEHTVKWLYDGNKEDVEITPNSCSSVVAFTPRHKQKSKYFESLKCNVTDDMSGQTWLCNVGPQSSCEKTEGSTSAGKNSTSSAKDDTKGLLYIIVAVGLAALLAAIIIVAVIRWKKTKGHNTQRHDNTEQSLNPAANQPGPETSQNTVRSHTTTPSAELHPLADPEDGVSYASVSYTKKTSSKALVRGKDADEEREAVTYSTVRAPSSSTSATTATSTDVSELYAIVTKPNKQGAAV